MVIGGKTMTAEHTPIWEEREQATVQITDRTGDGTYLPTIRPSQNSPEGEAFSDWVNSYREPLHQEIHGDSGLTQRRLDSRGIHLQDIATIVSSITKQPALPLQRIQSNGHLQQNRTYNDAVEAVTPGLSFTSEDAIDGQYNPLLGVIALNERFLREAGPASISDTLAKNIGQACLGSLVSATVQLEPEPRFRYWYGYQWWHDGERYGGALQKASTTKVAALARLALDVYPQQQEAHPLLRHFQREEGFYYESGIAMALDTINRRLGFDVHQPGIYEAIWEFSKQGEDENARQELAHMVARATDGRITLPELEALQPQSHGLPLTLLRRVEEACKVPCNEQVSPILAERLARAATAQTAKGF
jgi:hypothetical protein